MGGRSDSTSHDASALNVVPVSRACRFMEELFFGGWELSLVPLSCHHVGSKVLDPVFVKVMFTMV